MALVSVTSAFTTEEKLEDVQAFFEAHPTPSAERTIQQSLERIRLNIAWLDLNREALAERFGS
jgi:puromycin-sensitive aminopeptidase